MAFEAGPKGIIDLCPLLGWDTAILAGSACGLRLSYAPDLAAIRTGGRSLQLSMTPIQALELAHALRRMAERAMATPPAGQAD